MSTLGFITTIKSFQVLRVLHEKHLKDYRFQMSYRNFIYYGI